jgi:5-oxopent-3-ene-1,2,5-tricarboxylate decarboxylase/2-hydroxyhepta-2,4-diene-1,7-dioate isomerase
MRVVTFDLEGEPTVGLLHGEQVLDFSRAFLTFLAANELDISPALFAIEELIDSGLFVPETFQDVMEFLEDHELLEEMIVEEAELLPPFLPNRIIALGRNYAAHAQETGHEPPKAPVFFMKATSSIIGPEEPVLIPKEAARVDHEVELAVVIGKGGRRIPNHQAMEHVAGYTILNDVTERDMQTRDMAVSHPWFLSKSFDTFGPLGPCIALPDEIPDPHNLALKLTVNGEVRQESNTSDLIFKIPELIAALSQFITLEPGDLISTGTPEGISPLKPGDVMEAAVEGIGTLRNPVEREK